MKQCINCGCTLDDEARFCGECGTKQPEPVVKCVNCGAELIAGAKFCMECGTPVAAKEQSAPVAAAVSAPTTQPGHDAEVSVSQPDKDTVSITIKGITFNLKRVKGCRYGSKNEVQDFLIGETPVTQALWFVLMEDNPSEENGNINFPVTNINTSLATAFMLKLQKLTGVKFELPTNEQWKYAYKGGARSKGYKYAGGNDLSEIGWTDGKLHPVGELLPNELGVADMVGNVEELLKGKEWSPITPDNRKKRSDNNLSGLRVVVNIPAEALPDKGTPMQIILSGLQGEMLSEIERVREENKRKQELARQKAEEEARIKAAEEARRKAEQEARRKKAEKEARIKAAEDARRKAAEEERRKKAAEEARIKAEKEAKEKAVRDEKLKAEREARQREEARIRAAEEARIKAEKEARCKELAILLTGLQLRDEELGSSLKKLQTELSEKQSRLSELERTVAECDKVLDDIEQKGEALERRYRVVLTKRVESGLFNNKGAVFDARLCEITGASKEQLKEWYQELKKAKRVIISDAVECVAAASWKIGIEEAGGQAEIGQDIDDAKAEELMREYKSTYDEKYTLKLNAQKEAEGLTPTIKALTGQTQALLAEYKPAHLEFKKCKLEIDYLSSGHTLKDFIKESDADNDNGEALSALFGDKYVAFKKAEEEARIKAEEEARKKAEEEARQKAKEEQQRIAAEKRRLAQLAKKEQERRHREMNERVKGIVRYSKGDEAEKAYMTVFDKEIQALDKTTEAFSEKVNKTLSEGNLEWKEYLTDYYWRKSVLKYIIIDRSILVVNGEGTIPDVETGTTEGKNIWHIVNEFKTVSDRNPIKTLVITGRIRHIGANCFRHFHNLETVIMPDGVETIGSCAFSDNVNLKNVKLPSCLQTIEGGAFNGACLNHVMIPAGVRGIRNEAFGNCNYLTTVLVPASAKVEDGAFSGSKKL